MATTHVDPLLGRRLQCYLERTQTAATAALEPSPRPTLSMKFRKIKQDFIAWRKDHAGQLLSLLVVTAFICLALAFFTGGASLAGFLICLFLMLPLEEEV